MADMITEVRDRTIGIKVKMATYTLLEIVDKQWKSLDTLSVALLSVEQIINFRNPIDEREKG
jgi:hypothetical protein